MATQGALTHIEDPGLLAVRAWKIQVARAQWRMLLDIYKAGRVHKQVRAEAGSPNGTQKKGLESGREKSAQMRIGSISV